jgi:hypothetical protein
MPTVIPVEAYHDLVSDDDLDLREADAIASALDRTSGKGVDVLHLPRELAAEKILDPEEGTECVFVAELLPERETDDAYYAKQGACGNWLPKSTTRIYVQATDADIYVPDRSQETEGSA